MIVFIAGMPRSGSTFCFNIARDILRSRGDVLQMPSANLARVPEEARSATHVLLKSHEADPACLSAVRGGSVRAICSLRRPEDAIASWIEVFGQDLDDSIAVMQRWILMFRQIETRASILSFSLIERLPLVAAWRVARFVDPQASWSEIGRAARRVEKRSVEHRLANLDPGAPGVTHIGFSYYESDTFLHRRHVSQDGSRRAARILTPDQIKVIRSALASEIDARGHLRRAPR